ncbi:hypothetical protein [Aporhodopirellula aestuarii]|uniref:hypothetical protein n=1 Tax=Aporhodopirellula aestuarii TaxID=2950107 RepID=UPI002033F850|nr:hypothetical protein [Aporhodopirellula aestuarii]
MIERFQAGDTIRTDRHRLSLHTRPGGKQTRRMLYDHQRDPDENVNVSEKLEQTKIVNTLTTELHKRMGEYSVCHRSRCLGTDRK